METYHAAFLRGITNVAMRPFVDALERLGLTAVVSFGASGNLVFCADAADSASLESRIAQAVGVEAFVRSRDELSAIVTQDPHSGRKGAMVFLAKRPPDRARIQSLNAGGFNGDPPVVSGATVYFVSPTRRPGRKSPIDFERELGVSGTIRSSKVIARVLDLM